MTQARTGGPLVVLFSADLDASLHAVRAAGGQAACPAHTRRPTLTSRPRTTLRSSINCAPRRSKAAPRSPPLPGSLCADHDGFSLHAKVLVPAGELERLEHLCRHVIPPPIVTQRLALAPNARVVYGLKRQWRDGMSAVSFDPLTFIEQRAALVPHQRAHQLTYHGVLAQASIWRENIMPRRAPVLTSHLCGPLAPHSPTAPRASARSCSSCSTWVELLRCVFAVDVSLALDESGPAA